jgi:hypothetical protein
MTNEERDLITRFIQRVGGAQQASGFSGTSAASGSVPATQSAQPLPPIDREADALIADLFNRNPEARYRITQLAFVQEHALVEAQNVIQRLQWELQQARQAQPQPGASPWGSGAQQQQSGGGIFSGLFGGGRQQQPPPPPQYAPPPPQYPPGYQPGMFAQRGSGFLGSALGTAAGVAGGVLAADALMSLFRGGGGGFGGGFGGFGGGYPAAPVGFVPHAEANPWGGGGSAPDPYDAGGAPKDSSDTGWTTPGQGGAQDPGWQDTSQTDSGWQDTSQTDTGWQDTSSSDDGGWTDTSGGGDPSTC